MANLSAALPAHHADVAQDDARADDHITEADQQHLESFPRERKAMLIQRILSRDPDKTMELAGKLDFERTLQRLRRDHYALIDLQFHETAFYSVWFRKSEGVMDWRRMEVAMVLWDSRSGRDPVTTVQTWLL